MQEALDACKGLFTRFAEGDACSLKNCAVIVLALERNYVETDLRMIVQKLGRQSDGALNLLALCEVISYVMKGSPHTHDTLTLVSPAGRETTVTLADVAAAGLKALYTMHPTFDEQKCWLNTESALASHCTAEGDAVTFAATHAPASFLIRARDWVERECTAGGEAFEVRIKGPATFQAEVTDRGDGTYVANYTATISGSYAMHVTLGRHNIAGSPFSLTVDVDQTRPEFCIAEGAGLSHAEAGKAATFVIYKRDRNGHARTRGVDHFYADVQGPGKWDCKIKDQKDGSYAVTYTARAAGTYRLDVGLAPNAGPIAHSPFTIVVRSAAPDPRNTTLVAPPPATVLCGRPFTLQLTARDRWGNLCSGGGSPNAGGVEEAPSAWISLDGSKAREAAEVRLLEPGRYALSITPVAQGRSTAHVCWAGMQIKGSPFQLRALPAPPHASSYKLTLKPRTWPELTAGARFKLRVQAHDRFGNAHTTHAALPRLWLQGASEGLGDSDAPGSFDGVPAFGGGGGGGGFALASGAAEGGGVVDGASPRWAGSAETLGTRLRSQLLSDFGLGDKGNPLPEAWARLVADADDLQLATGGRGRIGGGGGSGGGGGHPPYQSKSENK